MDLSNNLLIRCSTSSLARHLGGFCMFFFYPCFILTLACYSWLNVIGITSLVKGTAPVIFFFFFFSDGRYALEVQWLTCIVVILVYFHNTCFCCLSGYLLDTCLLLFFYFYFFVRNGKFLLLICPSAVVNFTWSENGMSCTESISCI